MEPHTHQFSFLIPFLFSLLFFNSISISLSHPSLAPEISPGPQPAASSSQNPQSLVYEESLPQIFDPSTESQSISVSLSLDSSKHNPFLEKICSSTDYPDLCIATISPHLKGKTDIISILNVAMNTGFEATKMAILLAKRMSKMPGCPSDMASILNDCKDSYEDALDNFRKAIEGLSVRDVGLMNSMLSAVITDVTDCEDGFSGNVSPLATYTDKIVNMTSNCLAIVSLIQDQIQM